MSVFCIPMWLGAIVEWMSVQTNYKANTGSGKVKGNNNFQQSKTAILGLMVSKVGITLTLTLTIIQSLFLGSQTYSTGGFGQQNFTFLIPSTCKQ